MMSRMHNCRPGAARLAGVTWRTARPAEELDHRLQLLISSGMLARVRAHAGLHGVSASELIRQLIWDGLEQLDVVVAASAEPPSGKPNDG